MKIYLAQINPVVGDLKGNAEKILRHLSLAKEQEANLVLFPELALSGYPPEDLLLVDKFLEDVAIALEEIVGECKGISAVVGLPRANPEAMEKGLFNSAAVISDQKLLGFYDKHLLPTYDVFDERRYFEPGEDMRVWDIAGWRVAVTVCEDIWQHGNELRYTNYQSDPVLTLKKMKPDLLLNLSSSPFSIRKPAIRKAVGQKAVETVGCPLLLCNQIGGNDSLIFDGNSMILNADGDLIAKGKGFHEDVLIYESDEEYEPIPFENEPIEDLFHALVLGTRDYFSKQGFKKACIGLSGGIDSAVVACIAKEALGKEDLLTVLMPSRFSSKSSIEDAEALAENLGIRTTTIPIESPYQCFLDLLEPAFQGKKMDTTEENIQARIRGIILMALSNKHGYLVLSTGNKSEMAVGYTTLYGDLCGGLSVLADATKMQVYALAKWINRKQAVIPDNILIKPPSAELRPGQKDSDALPDYAVLDTILNEYIVDHLSIEEIAQKHEYPIEVVRETVEKIHRNEYKRRQAPPGLRISERAFSIGRRFPIVQKWV